MNQQGDLLDPYFAADSGSGLMKDVVELTMYETDDGHTTQETVEVPDVLWKQHGGPRSLRGNEDWTERRLDTRWRSNKSSFRG